MLVDAGAEHRGYTADITRRTFPAGGVFEARRKAVYEATLDVQNTAIEAMKPGVNWRVVSEAAKVQTVQRLVDLGLASGRAEDATYAGVASLFLPHSARTPLGTAGARRRARWTGAGAARGGARGDVRAGHLFRRRTPRTRV